VSVLWTAPWAAVAALGVVLPIWAHLSLRRPTDRRPFGAMMLLERVMKRLRRQRRVQDVALLALRVFALLAAVLAVVGPVLRWTGATPVGQGATRTLLVIDKSRSMNLSDGSGRLIDRARSGALARLAALPLGGEVAVLSYGAQVEAVTAGWRPVDDPTVRTAIEALAPGDGRGDLRAALHEARRLLDGASGDVVVFTDEAGPTMIPEAAAEIVALADRGVAVVPAPVHADPAANLEVASATWSEGLEGGEIRFVVRNYGSRDVEVACEARLPDAAVVPVFVTVPAGDEAQARATVPRGASGGVGRVHCDDPTLAGDDDRWFHVPASGAGKVWVVDGDPGDTPIRSEVFFLERALAPGVGGAVVEVLTPPGLSRLTLQATPIAFLANVGDPRPHAEVLRGFVRAGGTLVISAGDTIVGERWAEALGELMPAAIGEPVALADLAEAPIPLVAPDAAHRHFGSLEPAARAAFARMGAWRALGLEGPTDREGVTVWLRYEGGTPALVERRAGDGSVLLWTSTFDLGWSNAPLQAAFLPFVQRILSSWGRGVGDHAVRLEGEVGRPVALPDVPMGARVRDVDGAESALDAPDSEGRVRWIPPLPGAYTVLSPDGRAVAQLAVQPSAGESDVRRSTSIVAVGQSASPDLYTRALPLGDGLAWAALLTSAGAALFAARRGRAPEEGVA
jgi:hypothetical protein